MECCFEGFGMFNGVVNGLQLSCYCKDVYLESLVFQTRYKIVLDVDSGYVGLQAGQLNSQSTARECILMRKSFIDSPSLCKRLLFVTIFSVTLIMADSSILKNVE